MGNTSSIFISVVDKHKGIIYKVASMYCRNEEDRKDLTQEIIFQLWRSFDRYNGQYQYSTWIYRIALNVAISFYRKELRRKTISNPLPDEIIHLSHTKEDHNVGENIRLLQQVISGLKELDRALMLLYLEEKSYREMAAILGLSETNIATKISRIKAQIKKKLITINP